MPKITLPMLRRIATIVFALVVLGAIALIVYALTFRPS
jgi:hypothetical protein